SPQKRTAGLVQPGPAYRALVVYDGPSVVGHEALCAQLATLSEQTTTTAMPPAREVELPCCYGGELGLDLEAAARRLELSMDELVRLHAGAEYLVLHRLHAGPAVHDRRARALDDPAPGHTAGGGPRG